MKEPWVCGQCGILVTATNQKPEYTYLEKMGCCRVSISNPISGPSFYEHHLRVFVHKNQILGSVEEALYYHDAPDWLRVGTLTGSLDSPWEEITDAFEENDRTSFNNEVIYKVAYTGCRFRPYLGEFFGRRVHTCLERNLRVASALWLSMCSRVGLVRTRGVNGSSGMNDGTVIRIIQ